MKPDQAGSPRLPARLRQYLAQLLYPLPGRHALPAWSWWRGLLWLAMTALALKGIVLPLSPQQAAAPASGALTPGTVFRDCEDDFCPWMVVIPPGKFEMGSLETEKDRFSNESPQHEVNIAYPLALMQAEVTRAQYAAFVVETNYRPEGGCYVWQEGRQGTLDQSANWEKPGFPQSDTDPVVCVSWNDARNYARWLAKRTGRPYRLPSEAEWEYAARGGTQTAYFYGNDPDQTCGYGNVADQVARAEFKDKASGWTFADCNDGHAYTAPARSYKPNAFGLYDTTGNVWEWTEDCYHGDYQNARADGTPWNETQCETHVLRGGGWGVRPAGARSASRVRDVAGGRGGGVGFRLARTISP